METEVTKKDLERAVPAAREPKGKIFDALKERIEMELSRLLDTLAGDTVTRTMAEQPDTPKNIRLLTMFKDLACVTVFVNEMRGLDLVLTSTGFGVVSTQDTAPASQARVNALLDQLRKTKITLRCDIIGQLMNVEGWGMTACAAENVENLFWHVNMLEQYAGVHEVTPMAWNEAKSGAAYSDLLLRGSISNEYMDELLLQVRTNALTASNRYICSLCHRYMGMRISGRYKEAEGMLRNIIDHMERNASDYPTYHNSEAYKSNHIKPYENHAEDSAFHFVG